MLPNLTLKPRLSTQILLVLLPELDARPEDVLVLDLVEAACRGAHQLVKDVKANG